MKLLYLGLLVTCFLPRGEATVYDYSDGPFGPAHWGELDPDWILCSTGLAQSPVNLTSGDVLSDYIPGVEFSFSSGDTVLQIRDHDLAVLWTGDGGGVWLAGMYYKLIQFHLHSPSEHTLDGIRFPLEMHMVHQSADGQLAVVTVLYTDGEEDDFLLHAMEELTELLASGEKETDIGSMTIDSMDLGTCYYRYSGSLTTPPCTEGVSFIIMKKTRTVAAEQVQALVDAGLGNNARPIQPLNGRDIYESETVYAMDVHDI